MTEITCRCGAVVLKLDGPPILSAECHCASCRAAAQRLDPDCAEANGGTGFVLQRKDRVQVVQGEDRLASFRLSPEAGTERIVASCCAAPMWLQFKGGHWLSLYAARWPEGSAPPPQMRTMTRDALAPLPDDIPNARTQSAGFMARLFWAWVQMGFRNPPVADVGTTYDV